jgi:peptidoglycan/LPS O-acetylase OafA/YrhL
MILYLVLISIATLRVGPRIAILTTLVIYTHLTAKYYLWTFFLGSLLCQINVHLTHIYQRPSEYPTKKPKARENITWIFVFVFGLYMLAMPHRFWEKAPFYGLLLMWYPTSWAEPYWFWHGLGAAAISAAAAHHAGVQRIFSNRFARFLGRISYGLYLVHGIVIRCFGLRWAQRVIALGWTMDMSFFPIFMVQVPLSLVFATWFTKLCSDTAITLSKWVEKSLEGKTVVRDEYLHLPLSADAEQFDMDAIELGNPRGMKLKQ